MITVVSHAILFQFDGLPISIVLLSHGEQSWHHQVKYLYGDVQKAGGDAARFYADDVIYEDMNYETPFTGQSAVEGFLKRVLADLVSTARSVKPGELWKILRLLPQPIFSDGFSHNRQPGDSTNPTARFSEHPGRDFQLGGGIRWRPSSGLHLHHRNCRATPGDSRHHLLSGVAALCDSKDLQCG